jgi:hypothetical protein
MQNFHLPLPDRIYGELKEEAVRSGVPATSMAREAIQAWLKARKRAQRKADIAAFAESMAGTEFDLDSRLERATIEFLTTAQSPGQE